MTAAAAGWLLRHLGRRGVYLTAAGAGKVCWGAGFLALPPDDLRPFRILTRIAPLQVWAWLWIAAGSVMLGSAWLRIGRDWLGYAAGIIPPAVWAASYLGAMISGTYPRGIFVFGWYVLSHVVVIVWASTVPEHSVPSTDRGDPARE